MLGKFGEMLGKMLGKCSDQSDVAIILIEKIFTRKGMTWVYKSSNFLSDVFVFVLCSAVLVY
jgi:hypothetical protein